MACLSSSWSARIGWLVVLALNEGSKTVEHNAGKERASFLLPSLLLPPCLISAFCRLLSPPLIIYTPLPCPIPLPYFRKDTFDSSPPPTFCAFRNPKPCFPHLGFPSFLSPSFLFLSLFYLLSNSSASIRQISFRDSFSVFIYRNRNEFQFHCPLAPLPPKKRKPAPNPLLPPLITSAEQSPAFGVFSTVGTRRLSELERRVLALIVRDTETLGSSGGSLLVLCSFDAPASRNNTVSKRAADGKRTRSKRESKNTHSLALLSLICSSHTSLSHQGKAMTLFPFNVLTKSFHSYTTLMCSLNSFLAFASISAWIFSRKAGIDVARSSRERGSFAPVSRRTDIVEELARSLGPTSRRMGTP